MVARLSLLVFKKKVEHAFDFLKKFSASNQHRGLRFVEKRVLQIKGRIERRKVRSSVETKRSRPERREKDLSSELKAVDPFDRDASSTKGIRDDDDSRGSTNRNTDDSLKDAPSEDTNFCFTDAVQEENDRQSSNRKRHTCILCREEFKSHSLLIDHLFRHSGTPQSCLKCKKFFHNALSYKSHVLKNVCDSNFTCDTDTFKSISVCELLYCPYCGKKYSKTFNLKRHIGHCDFLKIDNDISDKSLKCSICHVYCDKNRYDKHYSKHLKNHCSKCKATFPTRKLLQKHNSIHKVNSTKTYLCEVCNVSFRNRQLHRDHLKLFKADPKHIENKKLCKSAQDKVWCKICQKSFIDEKTYKRHCLRQNHLKTKKIIIPNKQFICEKCGFDFKNKEGLIGHIRRMHKSKSIVMCEFCPYSTTITSNMLRHKQNLHEKSIKEHACDKCPTLFSSLSNLKEHIQSVHSLDRPFSCSFCPKTFKLQTQLKRHRIIHDPVLPHPCTFCTSGFRRSSQLKRHLLSRHSDDTQNTFNTTEYKSRKNQQAVHPQTTVSEVPNTTQDDQMFYIDVQSGELVLLSMKDMSKNNVINMETEGDLLNGVNMPDTWTNPENDIYCTTPILHDNRDPHSAYMMSQNFNNAQTTADVQTKYIPHFAQPNGKNIELLSNEFEIVKENPLSQNNLNSEIIVTNTNCNDYINFCSLAIE